MTFNPHPPGKLCLKCGRLMGSSLSNHLKNYHPVEFETYYRRVDIRQEEASLTEKLTRGRAFLQLTSMARRTG